MGTGASRGRNLYLTIPIRLVRNPRIGYPYPAGRPSITVPEQIAAAASRAGPVLLIALAHHNRQ